MTYPKIAFNEIEREMTDVEKAEYDAKNKAYSDAANNRKLGYIKEERLQKLKETDWWVLRGNMTESQSTYRQNLRNIPQDYSEDKYDELLARDEQGNLTHSIWEKP
tara:strand:- start:129 stop:446 length:318 start_codon:yes stop_codon:yes gene_type:complete